MALDLSRYFWPPINKQKGNTVSKRDISGKDREATGAHKKG